jgi:hypothetical protein
MLAGVAPHGRGGGSDQQGAGQAAVADLRTPVERRARTRVDAGLDVGEQLLDAALFPGIEQVAAGRAALRLDLGRQAVQPCLIAAACQAGVVALARGALGHVAADAGTGTDDRADGSAHGHLLCVAGLRF